MPRPVQPAFAHKGRDFTGGHHGRLMHLFVVCEQIRASALVTDKQLAEDEVMGAHVLIAQQPVKLG